jgi:competence ComEA-like helix-hairpin-helix protein
MIRSALSVAAASLLCLVQPVTASAQTKAPARPAAKTATTAVVNINTASATEIATLPGIGAKMAARIVEYRQKNGPFKKVEDILENSRSGPILLSISSGGTRSSVSRSRRKPQEISR